jgi:hypothetical protein
MIDALVRIEQAPVASSKPARVEAREPSPTPAREAQAPLAAVCAGLFFASGVALQESAIARHPGYALLGALALGALLTLLVIDRTRKRG